MSDYPHEPGWRDPETSREAAEAIAGMAGTLRRLVYDHIRKYPLQTADDIANKLHMSTRAIQPRVSELRALGLIMNDGRGRNPSGHAAHLWRAVL
jgi:predicted transcriptional regulator